MDRPTVPTEKTAPHTAFDTLIGAVIGVIVACIVIIVREVSDTTVYLTEDVSGVTVLGRNPEDRSAGRQIRILEINRREGRSLWESCRSGKASP